MQLKEILKRYPVRKDYLLEVLLDVDENKENHFISENEITEIASYLGTKESHVCSVMSFYTLLSNHARGKYIIQICKDVPCFLNDDFNLVQTITDYLGVTLNETTKDKLFTVEYTACIGCCDESPAMRINHETYTSLTKEKAISILNSLKGDS